jgi:YjbE family integral membrane protein
MEIAMELIGSDFLSGLLAIILLDLVLAGDNAIVIAMAASRLPGALQKKAVFWGTFGAVAVRFLLIAAVLYLLKLPGLMLAGGLLLLPIAWKLLHHHGNDPDIGAADTFWSALRTIIVADALLGMDNVLAIAGVSKGQLLLVIIGLLVSVPLVVWGSTLILKLINRFPIIMYIGAGAIAFTAGRMIAHDRWLTGWFDAHTGVTYVLDVALVIGICGGGWLMNRRRRLRGPPAS